MKSPTQLLLDTAIAELRAADIACKQDRISEVKRLIDEALNELLVLRNFGNHLEPDDLEAARRLTRQN